MKGKIKKNTKFDEEINKVNTKIQDVIKEVDNIKTAVQILTKETQKTLVISNM